MEEEQFCMSCRVSSEEEELVFDEMSLPFCMECLIDKQWEED